MKRKNVGAFDGIR